MKQAVLRAGQEVPSVGAQGDGEDRPRVRQVGMAAGPSGAIPHMNGPDVPILLTAAGGNKSRAAKILGIERKTLYRKLERMGLHG